MYEVRIAKGGKLFGKEWQGKKRRWHEKRISMPTVQELHDYSATLDDGLVLRDIFLLIKKNLPYWDFILGNWCKDYVSEGLSKNVSKSVGPGETLQIDYLDLDFTPELDKWKGKTELEGVRRLNFGAQGHYLKGDEYAKAGSKTAIGVGFTPTYELAPYEIRLDKKFHVMQFRKTKLSFLVKVARWLGINRWSSIRYEKIFKADECHVSLFDVLYAIFWELSFYGPPAGRDKMRAELKKRVDDLKSGKAKTVPFSEVKKRWKKRAKQLAKKTSRQ